MTSEFNPIIDRLLFGGSFDPPHRGHMEMVRWVLENEIASFVDLVPARVSPLKTDAPPIDADARFRLVELSLAALQREAAGNPWLTRILSSCVHVHRNELDRPDPSYTADTCREFRAAYPDARIGILVGADSLFDLLKWDRIGELFEYHTFFVFKRELESEQTVKEQIQSIQSERPEAKIELLDSPLNHCSSTDLRAILQEERGEDVVEASAEVVDCLSPEVIDFIQRRRLYTG